MVSIPALPALPSLPRRYHKASVWALYVIGLCPAVWDFYLAASGALGFNPVKEFEHLLGTWALRFIIATLAITPIRDLLGINWMRYRRALGLIAFYYVLMHVAVYVSLDLRFDFGAVWSDIVRRWYITIGMACLLLLIPLAVTSNNWSIRKLSGAWNTLHKLIYPIAIGGVIHYTLSVKSVTLVPSTYIALIALLVVYRAVRRPILDWKRGKRAKSSGVAV